MTTITARHRLAGLAGVTVLTVGALAACGGGSSSTANAAASSPAASSSTGARGFGGNRIDAATEAKITACLKAAGISVPTFSPRARPTGSPTFVRPTGTPTGRPTGGFAGRGGGIFGSTQAQAALKACGITLPSRGAYAGRSPGATPAATAAS